MNFVTKLGGLVLQVNPILTSGSKTAPSTAASKAVVKAAETVSEVIAASRPATTTAPASPEADAFATRFNRGGSGATPPTKAAVEAARVERVGEWSDEPPSVLDVIRARKK